MNEQSSAHVSTLLKEKVSIQHFLLDSKNASLSPKEIAELNTTLDLIDLACETIRNDDEEYAVTLFGFRTDSTLAKSR